MKMVKLNLPMMALAASFAILSAVAVLGQSVDDSQDRPRRTRVVATGRLTGTHELQQVIVWQSAGVTHLAVETVARPKRILWEADGGNWASQTDSVLVSDLDGDGVPEIVSLWRTGSTAGAMLRVFHWQAQDKSFAEVQAEGVNESHRTPEIRSYRIAAVSGRKRILVFTTTRPGGTRGVPDGQFELRGNRLVRLSGGIIKVDLASGIEGHAVISPTHGGPVRRDEPGPAPYKTTLVIWSAGTDQEVTRVETGSDGRFRVALPPGTYRVGPPHNTGRSLPRGSEQTVTVEPGKFVQVTIEFDSGMR